MHKEGSSSNSNVVRSIGVIVVLYFAWLLIGPDRLATGSDSHGATESGHASQTIDDHDESDASTRDDDDEHGTEEHAGEGEPDEGHGPSVMPHYYAVLPFVLLLAAIAILPLLKFSEHWWESNLHRFYVAIGLAFVTLLYYCFRHPAGGGLHQIRHVLDHAVLREFIPFIVLLFSLYTIAGGIRIEGDLVATPETNAKFLIVGGCLASFIGTTGAAMLLIRPLIDTNDERKYVQHTIVFFIIVVCNCGGCLLPIGDPPLFLGYLMGVDFLWTMKHLWWPWLVTNAILIAVYYVLDRFFYYQKETKKDLQQDTKTARPLSVQGLWPHAFLLFGVILCVALLDPSKAIPGTDWHAPVFLREILQLVLVALSLILGDEQVRRENKFNYHAIVEVAALFIGIFICMQPAIEILHIKGGSLGLNTPNELFWSTGTLSAVLDNAPTYVVFFETAAADSRFGGENFAQLVAQDTPKGVIARQLLEAISLGAVFMGAMTYIGNGPNFMVRAIAEQSGVRMPSFFGYMFRYTIPFLVPIFILVTMLLIA